MNSARDRAENIIDELQAFLNQQQGGRDDSLASPTSDLDLSQSFSSNRAELQLSAVNGDSSEKVDHWESFRLPASLSETESSMSVLEGDDLGTQSKLAGSSEVLMTSGREEVNVQESHKFSTTLNLTKDGESENAFGVQVQEFVVDMKVNNSSDANMKNVSHIDVDGKTSTSSTSVSSMSSSNDVKRETIFSTQQSSQPATTKTEFREQKSANTQVSVSVSPTAAETGESEINTPAELFAYDFLEPKIPPPPPREIKDSAVMPFPMIFRRSKKDPGSKQYNALVKELEQVLDKRNKVRRSRSMRDDLELEKVPEIMGTLRGTKKLSSSTDNLSVFSNKALLNRLESHFKNRTNPLNQTKPAAENVDASDKEKADVQASSESTVSRVGQSLTNSGPPSLVNGHTHTQDIRVSSVQTGSEGHTGFHQNQTQMKATHEHSSAHFGHSTPYSAVQGKDHSVSVIKVSAHPGADKLHMETVTNGYKDGSNPPRPPAHEEHDSFSQDMSFGSEEDFPINTSTLPNLSHHYKKHHAVRASHSHVHQSRTNPDVMYRSHTLDSNFRHITRIAVSKSTGSLPEALSETHCHPPQQNAHDSSRWVVERQNSVPMKTIVEHFNETDPEDVSAWNAAIKNSKKHKEKGLYRSISQRMVQKIYRFVRPKSTGSVNSAQVSRSSSFSQPVTQNAHTTQHSANGKTSDRKGVSSHGKAGNFVVEFPSQAGRHSSSKVSTDASAVSRSSRKEAVGTVEPQRSSAGSLTVQLPNSHKASIVSVSPQLANISSSTISVGSSSDYGVTHSKHVSRTQTLHSDADFTKKQAVHSQTGLSHSARQSQSVYSVHDSSLTVQLPNNHKAAIVPSLPSKVSTNKNGTPQVFVSPQKRSATVTRSSSLHRQTYRPPSQGSPFTQEIGEGVLPPAHGDGLYRGEEDKPATFYIDARGMTGEPSVQVDGPNSIAKCSIDPQPDGQYAVTYVPVEVGMFDVQVKWNGKELPGSPFHPKVVCARKVLVVGGWQHYMDSKERVHLVVNEEKQIPFDVSEAGPGKMTAEVKGPSGLIPVTVDDSSMGRSTVIFTPREEGVHYIHLFWSDTHLTSSPFHGYATSGILDPSKVILTGRGLKEAIVREEAEFMIDASQAGTGEPEVQLTGVRAEVNCFVTPLGGGKFRCTYIPVVPGAYLLHITWNGRQLRGSPYKVNVIGAFYPNKVVVAGEGLKGGLLGRDLDIRIDTRKAGPGELTAYCMGPTKVAHCELEDHHDGTFRLIVRPQELGRHVLQVKYGGEHVLGSPFSFKVSAQPDASKVRVSGPGVEHGILATFQSRFVVETRGAGAGQLTVRIRGPKGAFQVEMYRDSQKDRTILCRYDPTETGLYIISIRWSGMDVPGSPFHVHILDTQAELEQVLADQSFHNASFMSSRPNSSYGQWREEF